MSSGIDSSLNASRTRPAAVVFATVLAALPLLALGQFISHARTDEFDAWLFAHYGRELLAGRMLYRDLWDNKPPGIFWLNALGLWLGGGSLWGVFALCAGAVLAATATVFVAAKRLYGLSVAAIAAVMAALYLNIYPYHVGCNRPTTFVVFTELACFALYCTALTAVRGRRGLLVLAGFFGGLGPCLSQAGLSVSAAALAHGVYIALSGGSPGRVAKAVTALLLFGLGWCVAISGAAAGIYLTSDLHWAWDAVVSFNRLYFKAPEGASLVPGFFAVEEHLKVLGLPLILAAATLVQPLLGRRASAAPTDGGGRSAGGVETDAQLGHRPPGLLCMLWAWLVAAVYLALLGPHQRLHYWGVALPPLVMLAAHAVHLLLRAGRRIADVQPAFPVVVSVLWLGYMMIWPVQTQVRTAMVARYHRFEEPADPRYVDLVDAIRRHTAPQDAIFVFGYGPKLYWDAERHSAIRYIGTEKVGQLGDQGGPLMNRIIGLLMEARPQAIVTEGERVEVLPAAREGEEFRRWIESNYARPPDYPHENLWIFQENGG